MKLSKAIKPISYFKTHAAELIREINESNGTMIITQGGEAKVVVQDVHEYEKNREALALLRILSMSQESLKKGKKKPAKAVIAAAKKIILEVAGS